MINVFCVSFISVFAFLLGSSGFAQATFVKKEFCKKSEVELMDNDEVPKNYVIVGTSTFLKSDNVTSLDQLSKRQINRMRSFARRMKSCHVLIDFNGDLLPITDGEGKLIGDSHSSYYILQPSFFIEKKGQN